MTNPAEQFSRDCAENLMRQGRDGDLMHSSIQWMLDTSKYAYTYNFSWLGRPIIQFPQDIVAMQEIIWRVRPRLIIETGIAHGGSLIFSASMLELLGGDGRVLGVDIDIRKHNRAAIESHPMAHRIAMLEGSATDIGIVNQVVEVARGMSPVMVILDSNHTHEHVSKELRAYARLVSAGSYLVVCDTSVEDVPQGFFPNRAWDKGNNPRTAVHEFLAASDRFEVDTEIDDKLLVSANRGGYLRCIKE